MKLLNTKMPILLVVLVVIVFAGTAWVGVAQAQPKNIIFFIGDGMGFEQVKAARYYAGTTLSFESFPYQGELTTYSADNPVTDSAAAGTALASGYKVDNGVVSMLEINPNEWIELETLLEYFKAQGKSTGLVTTTYMAHATPACFGAHVTYRKDYDGIINDYLTQTLPNVLFGGRRYITADDAIAAGYTVKTCWDVGRDNTPDDDGLKWLDTETATMVSGQFYGGPENDYHIPYEDDGVGDLPHLREMTYTALRILDNDPDGFFLMVEGGRIDHACHANNIHKAILETLEFDNAVQEAIDWVAGRTDTLILVTADHETGGLVVLANNGVGNDPNVYWDVTGHTADNVPVYAWGDNSEMIYGTMDNTDMFGVCTAIPMADFDGDGVVNFIDYTMFANAWQTDNPDFSLDEDNDVDMNDLALFVEDWLWQAGWMQTGGSMMGQAMTQSLGLTEGLYPSVPAEQQEPQVSEPDIEEIINWLAELWLTDEEVRKTIDEDRWLRFMESVAAELK